MSPAANNPAANRLGTKRIPRHLQTFAAVGCAVLLFGLAAATIALARNPLRAEASSAPAALQGRDASEGGTILFREGTKLVDRLGYFRVRGDQVTFFGGEQEHPFLGLPNLNLERVARAITDDAAQLEWSVTGTITEYRGANYLLVERAILKAKSSRAPLLD